MIELQFGLFWSGAKLSFLRYLTFLTLRRQHPSARIELYIPNKCRKTVKWNIEQQDFQTYDGPCYLDKLPDLDIKIFRADIFPTYAPNYQSDFFRWWWLYNSGGFYLDTDQIILRNFLELPLSNDLIYSMYSAKSCGLYAPVGVVGAAKGCPIVKEIMDNMASLYNPNDYNSIGPFMFAKMMVENKEKWQKHKTFNAPSFFFYPLQESYLVPKLYEENVHVIESAFALHWFGGHPKSQEFNNRFTLDVLQSSDNTISSIIRGVL